MAADPRGIAAAAFDAGALPDVLSTGVVVLDERLGVVYANVGAQDLLAVGLNQARGRPIGELFVDPTPLLQILQRSLVNAETCAGHELALKPAGSLGPRATTIVDIVVTPLEGPGERRLLLELTDAGTRQRLTRENDMLSRLNGSRLLVRQLGHEIKNPLGGLRGAAQLLDRQLHDPALKEYIAVIINEADRLRSLVDGMLGPTRLPQPRRLNIHELCEHVFHLLRGEAPAGVVIERDYDPSLPSGLFDRDDVVQSLLNVARNAMQAVGDQGRIVLRTRVLSNQHIGHAHHRLVASVQVEDDGPGVPADLHHTLFYPLVTGRHQGTGLGLAVAQELATRHRGIIEFESRPGHTVFSLLLPLEGTE